MNRLHDHDKATPQTLNGNTDPTSEAPYNALLEKPPTGFASHKEGDALIIQRHWLPSHAPWFLVMMFIIAWGLWMHAQILPSENRNEMIFFLLFFPFTFYLFSAVFCNVTTIRATPESITISTQPFPLQCARTVKIGNNMERVVCQEDRDPERVQSFYKVSVIDSSGGVYDVENRLSDRSHAEFIATKLDEYYKEMRKEGLELV